MKWLLHYSGLTFVYNLFESTDFKIWPICIIWFFCFVHLETTSRCSCYEKDLDNSLLTVAPRQYQPKRVAVLLAAQTEAVPGKKTKSPSANKEGPDSSRNKPINTVCPDCSNKPNQQGEILKKGARTWNKWREKNPGVLPYLRAAGLQKTDLSNTNLWGADLRNADLSGADLRQADLRKAVLIKALLRGADLEGASLWKADIHQADLQKANLHKTDLAWTKLNRADLKGANLQLADLEGADLQDANLEETNLKGANLWGANLKKANLQNANINEANLWGANLQKANLVNADLIRANLEKADLSGASFQQANLYTTKKLTVEQLCRTKTLYKTKLNPILMEQTQNKCPALLKMPEGPE